MTKSTMSYLDVGSGFPVLLGHSFLFDKSMWSPQIESLAKHFRVIATDLWGHGDSPALPETVTSMADIAEDHLALIESLDINKFAVVGLSVGGMWGAELAALAPQRVKALMLLDTFVGSETEEEWQKYAKMLDAISSTGKVTSPLLEYVVSQFYSEHADPADVQHLTTYLASLTSEQLRTSILPLGKLIFGRPDRLSVLNTMTCPVHVATGELDLPRPVAEGERMAKKLGCDFTVIPQAAHISNRENPAFVSQLMVDFLTQHCK
ncbi:alpha/beta fold hydrolase [Vagococcus sp. WN89Y]|uniref:alpha/beta fold hydrolase n=1 Tax=Vagococcus sp. WN89Y TaxID=3457258 RepID=UPI003FCD2A3E